MEELLIDCVNFNALTTIVLTDYTTEICLIVLPTYFNRKLGNGRHSGKLFKILSFPARNCNWTLLVDNIEDNASYITAILII